MKYVISVFLLCLLGGCHYLDDYSQDLVVVKSVNDLDEVLLGSGYLQSNELIKELTASTECWWLHVLDDDVNTAVAVSAAAGDKSGMDQRIFGYTTWQEEVGKERTGSGKRGDDQVWRICYQHINAANIILAELKDLEASLEEEQKTALRVEGEARFLRAQFYLLLVNLYAEAYVPDKAATTLGVPLKLTNYVEHDKDKESQFERTSVKGVYDQIVEDLQASAACFSRSPQIHGYYRASQEAALLLLSRVYLYMQEWENAKNVTEDLLGLNVTLSDYQGYLNDPTAAVLTKENPEIIFSQGCLNVQKAFTGRGGDMCVSTELYGMYDAMDYRRNLYFGINTQSEEVCLSRKYETGDIASALSDVFMLRAAEAYLNMAEACAMLGDAAGASAWLNELRSMRIKDYQPIAYRDDKIIEQVRDERRKELCIEGHRWFDLKRYAVCVRAPFKKMIERKYACYDWESRRVFQYTQVYQLLEDDLAYTFAIPESVREFDTGMENNLREKREPVRLLDINSEEIKDEEEL